MALRPREGPGRPVQGELGEKGRFAGADPESLPRRSAN